MSKKSKKINSKNSKGSKRNSRPKTGIIFVKNSKNKSYKVRKRGRLGKNCVHYNHEKLSCKLSGIFCKSDGCNSYESKISDTLSEYNENYIQIPKMSGTHERTNEYISVSKNIGTPCHVGYLKSKDERRHKAKCIYYNKSTKNCKLLVCHCPGSSRCVHYRTK